MVKATTKTRQTERRQRRRYRNVIRAIHGAVWAMEQEKVEEPKSPATSLFKTMVPTRCFMQRQIRQGLGAGILQVYLGDTFNVVVNETVQGQVNDSTLVRERPGTYFLNRGRRVNTLSGRVRGRTFTDGAASFRQDWP